MPGSCMLQIEYRLRNSALNISKSTLFREISSVVHTISYFLQRKETNPPAQQAEAQLKRDFKATKTIVITMAVFLICFIPIGVFPIVNLIENNVTTDHWLSYVARYSYALSNTVNPIIYYTRLSRCRLALKQFIKDPFGSSDYREKPDIHVTCQVSNETGNNTEEKHGRGIQTKRRSSRQADKSKRRNAIVPLSF